MLKEILEGDVGFEMSPGSFESQVYRELDKAVAILDKASKFSKKLKEGSRLKKELDKIAGALYDEMEFVGRGEYS